MTLSGIELRYLVNEISKQTENYYISNIYGITKESILFKLHHPDKPDIMLMLSTFGFWISSVKINKIEQNRLLKRLRNDLLRLKITKIEQMGSERIVYLTIQGFDKNFILVGELFGDGNIILCNKDMKILALLHSIEVRHRTLKVGLQYTPPPSTTMNIFELKEENLDELKKSEISSAKWIGRNLGLPKKYVEEIFRITGIDPKSAGSTLSTNDIQKIVTLVTRIVTDVVSGNHEPGIIRTEKGSDVYPIKLGDPSNFQSVPTFFEGLDTIFTEQILEKGKEIQTSSSDKKINELKTRIEEQDKAILLVQKKSTEISSLAKSLMSVFSKGIITIEDPKTLEIFSQENSKLVKEKGQTIIVVSDDKLKIDPTASIPNIASKLFDLAKRKSAAIPSIKKIKKKSEKDLVKLQDQVTLEQDSVTFSKVRKKTWFERYRWFYTSDDLLAVGGRDASSNSSLIRKQLEKNDKVFHAEIHGSPFFLLKNGNESPPASLNEVVHATVCFSRAWRESMYGLSAYWVNPDQIKKSAPSGQFLPRGSFTLEGQRNFAKVSTLKLAVGLMKINENYVLTCGPPDPIKKNCVCYCIIEPSGSEVADLAKKIKFEFLKIIGEPTKDISIDDFVRVLPAGQSHLVDTAKGNKFE